MRARACCEARRTSGLYAPSAKPLRGTALALLALRVRPRLAAPHALRILLTAEAFPFGVPVSVLPELACSLASVLTVVLKMY
jgi:hypothetical protein